MNDEDMLKKVHRIFNFLIRNRLRVYQTTCIVITAIFWFAFYSTDELPLSSSQSSTWKYVNLQDIIIMRKVTRRSFSESTSRKWHHGSLKYILLWTPNFTPFRKIRQRGRLPFILNDCEFTNCFLTHKRKYFPKKTRFDAILFSLAALNKDIKLPHERSSRQKYVVASVEPPQKHSVVNPIFDNYFNWTWTYRLNSDILWRPFLIRAYDDDKILGPKINMEWVNHSETLLTEVSSRIEEFLYGKHRAVVWIITDCKKNENYEYYKFLEQELLEYGLSISTVSNCTGYKSCGSRNRCKNMVLKDYYFYLAYENYIDEDYVTDILLMALESLAVPIVLGGADYSRFLPPKSYLDARELTPKQLAKTINANMENFTLFQQYFWWVNSYYYDKISIESEICNICTALNNDEMVKNITTHTEFRKTWNDEALSFITEFLLQMLGDSDMQAMLNNKNYSQIRKWFKDKNFPDPNDSVFVFDLESLNTTVTEGSDLFMPDEYTTETSTVGDEEVTVFNVDPFTLNNMTKLSSLLTVEGTDVFTPDELKTVTTKEPATFSSSGSEELVILHSEN